MHGSARRWFRMPGPGGFPQRAFLALSFAIAGLAAGCTVLLDADFEDVSLGDIEDYYYPPDPPGNDQVWSNIAAVPQCQTDVIDEALTGTRSLEIRAGGVGALCTVFFVSDDSNETDSPRYASWTGKILGSAPFDVSFGPFCCGNERIDLRFAQGSVLVRTTDLPERQLYASEEALDEASYRSIGAYEQDEKHTVTLSFSEATGAYTVSVLSSVTIEYAGTRSGGFAYDDGSDLTLQMEFARDGGGLGVYVVDDVVISQRTRD